MEETVKEIYGTGFMPSTGTLSVLNPLTGSFETVRETGVVGRFARVKQLNGFKSRQHGGPVFDECVLCQIRVTGSVNKDTVSHKVAGTTGEECKKRFAAAWAEFEKMQAAHALADKADKNSVADKPKK